MNNSEARNTHPGVCFSISEFPLALNPNWEQQFASNQRVKEEVDFNFFMLFADSSCIDMFKGLA